MERRKVLLKTTYNNFKLFIVMEVLIAKTVHKKVTFISLDAVYQMGLARAFDNSK